MFDDLRDVGVFAFEFVRLEPVHQSLPSDVCRCGWLGAEQGDQCIGAELGEVRDTQRSADTLVRIVRKFRGFAA